MKQTALILLNYRPYNSSQMRTKLTDKGFSSEEIDEALIQIEHLGYIDDYAWAESLMRTEVRKGHSLRFIQGKLRSKGISEEITHRLISSTDKTKIEHAAMEKLFRVHYASLGRKKFLQRLMNRGFDYSNAQSFLSKIDTEQ